MHDPIKEKIRARLEAEGRTGSRDGWKRWLLYCLAAIGVVAIGVTAVQVGRWGFGDAPSPARVMAGATADMDEAELPQDEETVTSETGVKVPATEAVEAAVDGRDWKALSEAEKHRLVVASYALFPEMLGDGSKKYTRAKKWYAEQGVAKPSMRDAYSKGRRGVLKVGGKDVEVARTVLNLEKKLPEILAWIAAADKALLEKSWGAPVGNDRVAAWIGALRKHHAVAADMVAERRGR